MDSINCFLCNNKAEPYAYDQHSISVKCDICGDYSITEEMRSDHKHDTLFQNKKHLLSGYYKYCFLYDLRQKQLNAYYQKDILTDAIIPKETDVEKKLIYLLKYFKFCSNHFGDEIEIISEKLYPVAFARNDTELKFFIGHLVSEGLLYLTRKETFELTGKSTQGGVAETETVYPKYSLTIKGFEKCNEQYTESKQIFVAMQFEEVMFGLIENIKEDILNDTGYQLTIIIDKEFNDKIDDRIIAEINKSAAVIADFSHNNYGAYYEAGYAHGLGLPVIFICKDSKSENGKELIENVHFDTNHYSHILWKNSDDLKKKLINRINSTMNRYK